MKEHSDEQESIGCNSGAVVPNVDLLADHQFGVARGGNFGALASGTLEVSPKPTVTPGRSKKIPDLLQQVSQHVFYSPGMRFWSVLAISFEENSMNTRALKQHLRYKIPQIRLAILREPSEDKTPSIICTPGDFSPYLEPMKHLSEEHFVALHLSARNEIIGYHVVSHGTLSASLVHPREVYKAALLSNSASIVVAHNHPSGGIQPSLEDIETTTQLIAAGKILGVEVLDHLIVTYRSVISIRELHPELF
jgi:hypothetical protein